MSTHPPVTPQPAGKSLNPRTSGKAIASLVLGISSFFCACFTGMIAVIFGVLALGDISKSQGRLQGNGLAIAGIILGGIGCVWTIIWIALLLPAVQQTREAARQVTSRNNLNQLGISLLNYETAFRRFPPAQGGDGLSWRVHILPFMEQNDLYDQFHMDEPWDSPHNLTLVNRMPEIFKNPNHMLEPGKTIYLMPATPSTSIPGAPGPRAVFVQGRPGPGINDIADGTSFTILLLEANPEAAVTWTDPNGDWIYDPNDPMRNLGKARPRVILVGFADGHVQAIGNDISPREMNAMITPNGGEVVNQ